MGCGSGLVDEETGAARDRVSVMVAAGIGLPSNARLSDSAVSRGKGAPRSIAPPPVSAGGSNSDARRRCNSGARSVALSTILVRKSVTTPSPCAAIDYRGSASGQTPLFSPLRGMRQEWKYRLKLSRHTLTTPRVSQRDALNTFLQPTPAHRHEALVSVVFGRFIASGSDHLQIQAPPPGAQGEDLPLTPSVERCQRVDVAQQALRPVVDLTPQIGKNIKGH